MTEWIGQQLGNYRLTRLLGQGGFADVYLGEHLFLGTTIAVKILHAQVALEDTAQFQQEARILARLKHPSIVSILDFGIEERTPYLMMSYAPNGTLRTRHPKGTMLPVATVVEYVKQVAGALQYAHEHKIVHRDIKPENILIGEKNEILLSDFGIALIAQSSRYQNKTDMAGTIAYMAPEQIGGHPRTASDQYALGILAYEWLCGTRPFQGSFTEIAAQHSVTPPPLLRKHLSTLAPDIEYVILTALEKQPEKRFSSVQAFATALELASENRLSTEPRLHALSISTPLPRPAFPANPGTPFPVAVQGSISQGLQSAISPDLHKAQSISPPIYTPYPYMAPGTPPFAPLRGTPGPPHPYTPQPGPPLPPPPRGTDPGSGFALAGMILGIVSLVTLCSGIGIVTAIVGIFLSIRGRRSLSHRRMATAGLVMCTIVLSLLAIGLIISFILFVSSRR